jgi:GDP-mannose 4,6 dehydratase
MTEAFKYAGLDWRKHVSIDDRYKRPAEVDFLLADASKARRELGWNPKVNFHELVHQSDEGVAVEGWRRVPDVGTTRTFVTFLKTKSIWGVMFLVRPRKSLVSLAEELK